MKTVKEIARWSLVVGFYYLLLTYVGEMPQRQSWILALLLGFLSREVFLRTPAMRFTPYWVSVEPNWYQILADFKLIGSPEEWDSIQQRLEEEFPRREYHVLQRGLHFTVVQQSEDGARTLVYRDDHKCFASKIDLWEELAPRKLPASKPLEPAPLEGVRFFMKFGYKDSRLTNPIEGIAGYDLGIRVAAKWWEGVKASCPKPIHEGHDLYDFDYVELTLARISRREFDLYWEPVDWEDPEKRLDRHLKLIGEHRKKLNWVADETPGPPDWEFLEHKYFSVCHSEL